MPDPGANRRRFVRVRVTLRVAFSWEAQVEVFTSRDLSANGLLARKLSPTSPLPPLHARGVAEFSVDGTDLKVEAEVVRRTPDAFALRFIALPLALQDKLVAWVFRQEAQRRAPWS